MCQLIHKLSGRGWFRQLYIMVMVFGILGSPALSQAQWDICGCEGHPESLGAFDLTDPATWPPGTTQDGITVEIPLPPDGVLVFDSFSAASPDNMQITFGRNSRNTPVTLLVAGGVIVSYRVTINLDADPGGASADLRAGQGGLGGPGGFRGGDGGYQSLSGTSDGAEGLGPGGGSGKGEFAGPTELRPLIGGSGGAGGKSIDLGNCPAGGGGGGGGAILIAANQYINMRGKITVYGGKQGEVPWWIISCATAGYTGSGGAIRLVAPEIINSGSGGLYAMSTTSLPGIIRIESASDSYTGVTTPAAIRTAVIGPLVNPVASEIQIAAINDELVPETLTGPLGGIDFLVPASGLNAFRVETLGVPAGTTLDLSLKPKVGGAAIHETGVVNAANCDTEGQCTTLITVDLATGAYYVQAQATFQVP